MSRFGLDYTGNISAAAHRAVGSSFAARYLSGGNSKDLDPGEAQALLRGGVDTLVVWETTADRALQGTLAGEFDARNALAEGTRLGLPGHRPIYFAVDFDEAQFQTGALDAYFRGVNSVLGLSRTGVYGSFYVVNRMHDAGVCSYFWQTYAWSGGQVSGHANLLQYSNDHVVAGVGVDYDRALKADFGQWSYKAAAPKPPATPPRGVWRAQIEIDMAKDKANIKPMPGIDVRMGSTPQLTHRLVTVNEHTGDWHVSRIKGER